MMLLAIFVKNFISPCSHALMLSCFNVLLFFNSLLSSVNYQTAGIFSLSGRNAESRFAPRSFRMLQTDRLLAFTASVRMVIRIHRGTADSRTDAHSSFASGGADNNIHMIRIAGLSDSAKTFFIDQADFAGRHF